MRNIGEAVTNNVTKFLTVGAGRGDPWVMDKDLNNFTILPFEFYYRRKRLGEIDLHFNM